MSLARLFALPGVCLPLGYNCYRAFSSFILVLYLSTRVFTIVVSSILIRIWCLLLWLVEVSYGCLEGASYLLCGVKCFKTCMSMLTVLLFLLPLHLFLSIYSSILLPPSCFPFSFSFPSCLTPLACKRVSIPDTRLARVMLPLRTPSRCIQLCVQKTTGV